jgi:dTDP-4-amino-4,6-dideoxygalactose transaminase
MGKLAVNGGTKTIISPFPRYNSIGNEEKLAVQAVLDSGNLSGFFGSWREGFLGGPKVREFEQAWAEHFKVKYAVSFNSLTSGLIGAVGALGIEPGDEVIVSPNTMCATADAVLFWNAIPVFADIEEDTFNLDPASVVKNITPLTKAIIVTNIFGHPAHLDEIMTIAREHNLLVIEDNAQSPDALYHGQYAGTIGQIGGFSFNYHKHIHTGEGGIMITNDAKLAERMQLIRNHAEAVVGGKGVTDLNNMIGFNFRLGEMEAAIGCEQIKKLTPVVSHITNVGNRLSEALKDLPGLVVPKVETDCTNVYYRYAMKIKSDIIGVSRDKIIVALEAEGTPRVYPGYELLYWYPLYQQKIVYGSKGFPWNPENYQGHVSYAHGICPVAERMQHQEVISLQLPEHNYTVEEVDLVIKAFKKVWDNLNELK